MAKNRLLNAIRHCRVVLLCGLWAYSAEVQSFTGFGAEIDGYIRLAANRYQVSEAMLRGLVKMEDGWYGKVSPTGPIGVGQFTAKTWNWLAETERGKQLGMIPVTGYNRGTAHDPRRNKYINTLATALLARWHIEQFAERRIPASDENLYMAHNIGLDGFHRALQGRATRDDIENMRRNGMKPWHSVNDFLRYQKGRYSEHKSVANSQLPPRRVVSKETVATTTPQPATSRPNTRLILPAKIRYIDNRSSNLNWVEPTNSKLVWISPKN